MSFFQRLMKSVMPRKWFEAAQAESRTWMICCPCGAQVSVWDAGGMRWKGGGNPRRWAKCESCGRRTWQHLERLDAPK